MGLIAIDSAQGRLNVAYLELTDEVGLRHLFCINITKARKGILEGGGNKLTGIYGCVERDGDAYYYIGLQRNKLDTRDTATMFNLLLVISENIELINEEVTSLITGKPIVVISNNGGISGYVGSSTSLARFPLVRCIKAMTQ